MAAGLPVGVGGSVLLLLVCLAACCNCMIPSEDCFDKMRACPALTRAWCWCQCCGWSRRSTDWIDPELEPPMHHEKHRPFTGEVEEDGPEVQPLPA